MNDTPAPAQAEAEAIESPMGLWAKILAAQQAIATVEKKGENKDQHYSYVRAEDVIRDASSALNDQGLVAYVRIDEVETSEGQTRNGARSIFATVKGALVVLDPDSGETHDFPLRGTGTDAPGDKAIYKAQTGGTKYAYGAALQIAFGDDPEDDSSPGAKAAQDTQARRNGSASSDRLFGPPTDDVEKTKVAVLYALRGGSPILSEADEARAQEVLEQIAEDAGGYFPRVATRALLRLAAAIKADVEAAQAEEPEPDPDDDGSAEDPDASDPTAEPELAETELEPGEQPELEGEATDVRRIESQTERKP